MTCNNCNNCNNCNKCNILLLAVILLLSTAAAAAHVQLQSKPSPTTQLAIDWLEQGKLSGTVILQRKTLKGLKPDGFRIERTPQQTAILSPTDAGLLYGAAHLLRLQAQGLTADTVLTENPEHDLRLLNHWDNLDGTMERGYSGKSIFWPTYDKPHLLEYARRNAAVGINGVVLNNVNASPRMLTTEILNQAKTYADLLRPYGIRVYLAVNFSSPAVLDGLKTSDPLDKQVQQWWQKKARQIYQLIPDFGGFLVKANSEGQPGPMDFGRTHADGANMLARALRPYGGIVMWRAFVYSPSDPDRAKQAYIEFQPLDGQFLDNVIIQIKNGPIDFQPREPFSPLFGAMPKTPQMAELQITQEYLGHANHICFLASMWEEFLADIKHYAHYTQQLAASPLRAIAGVANVGTDPNFCGNLMAQSNWYAFGRLAWNSSLSSEKIAREWVAQTFGTSPRLSALVTLMCQSREAVVNYMMPLGLHHIFAEGHHYGPQPWQNNPGQRADWQCVYYHRADTQGVGFDRTQATGSAATAQYPADFASLVENITTCPDKYLLWFHHASWTHRCQTGRTLWDELCHRYQTGLQQARHMLQTWNALQPSLPAADFLDIQQRLQTQVRDAEWWKDACLLYFQTFSRQPLPDFVEPPIHTLDELKAIRLGISNYENPSRQLLNSKR
ncbi:MAG: alpha-glucuronidase [Bacteroidales bacterium]|nr:alpha-glucuronidase [Bacteroidales bacterium]